jgi:hypothetical protein
MGSGLVLTVEDYKVLNKGYGRYEIGTQTPVLYSQWFVLLKVMRLVETVWSNKKGNFNEVYC